MFGGFFGGYAPTGRFEASYRCYPVSFIDRMDAEKGDKVFLPPSALDRLCERKKPKGDHYATAHIAAPRQSHPH